MRRWWIAGVLVVSLIGCAKPAPPPTLPPITPRPTVAPIIITSTARPTPRPTLIPTPVPQGLRIDPPMINTPVNGTDFVSQGWSPSARWIWYENEGMIILRETHRAEQYLIPKTDLDGVLHDQVAAWLADDTLMLIEPVFERTTFIFQSLAPLIEGEPTTAILASSPDHTRFVLTSESHVAIYDMETGDVIRLDFGGEMPDLRDAVWSPDGSRVALTEYDEIVFQDPVTSDSAMPLVATWVFDALTGAMLDSTLTDGVDRARAWKPVWLDNQLLALPFHFGPGILEVGSSTVQSIPADVFGLDCDRIDCSLIWLDDVARTQDGYSLKLAWPMRDEDAGVSLEEWAIWHSSGGDLATGYQYADISPDGTMILRQSNSAAGLTFHWQGGVVAARQVIWHPSSRLIIAATRTGIEVYSIDGALLGRYYANDDDLLSIVAENPFSPDGRAMLVVGRNHDTYIVPTPVLP